MFNEINYDNLKYEAEIDRLCLLDLPFYQAALGSYSGCTEAILSVVLEKPDLHVTDVQDFELVRHNVETDVEETLLNLDILADDDGCLCRVQMPYVKDGVDSDLVEMLDDQFDSSYLLHDNVPENTDSRYIVYITEDDPFGRNKPIYTFQMMNVEHDINLEGFPIKIYVNASYSGDDAFGQLMADLRKTDPDQIQDPALQYYMDFLKNDPEGRRILIDAIEGIY